MCPKRARNSFTICSAMRAAIVRNAQRLHFNGNRKIPYGKCSANEKREWFTMKSNRFNVNNALLVRHLYCSTLSFALAFAVLFYIIIIVVVATARFSLASFICNFQCQRFALWNTVRCECTLAHITGNYRHLMPNDRCAEWLPPNALAIRSLYSTHRTE